MFFGLSLCDEHLDLAFGFVPDDGDWSEVSTGPLYQWIHAKANPKDSEDA